MTTHPPQTRARRLWPLAVLILLAAPGLRLAVLMTMPAFIDEGWHLNYAYHVLGGQPLIGLQDGRFLYPILLAAFSPTGPEGLWLARALSALAGLIAVAACVGLGRSLDAPRSGLLAGLLYAFLPVAIFHERQALADPAATALAVTGAALMVRLARRPRLWLALLLAALLAAAFLMKATALPYLALPPVAALLLAAPSRRRQALGLSAGASALAVGLVRVPYWLYARAGQVILREHGLTLGNTLLFSLGDPQAQALLVRNFADYGDILLRYFGPAYVALFALAAVWVALGERRRALLFLAVPAFAFVLIPLFARLPGGDAGRLASRYVLTSVPPMAALAAISLRTGLARLAGLRLPGAARAAVGLAAVIALALPGALFGLALARDYRQAALPAADRQFYVDFGEQDALTERAARIMLARSGARIGVLTDSPTYWLDAYIGPRTGEVRRLSLDDAGLWADVAAWLARGDAVYVVGDARFGTEVGDARLTPVKTYASRWGGLRLLRLSGAQGALAAGVYRLSARSPAELADDYAALAESAGRATLVFPPGHAGALAARASGPVVPLALESWPPDEGEVAAAVDALGLAPGALFDALLAEEYRSDPDAALRRGLQQSGYWLGETWAGSLHRVTYAAGPARPALAPLGAQFEGVIGLDQIALLDAQAQPGGVVRVALLWHSDEPVRDSFKVFLHVVDGEGALVAQQDGVPGGGLLPMTGWRPGEPVLDRVAIALPDGLPPGEYTLRVGIYHPESGLRLRATRGGGETGDYAVAGQLQVTAPGD